jgi:hypothetical protein
MSVSFLDDPAHWLRRSAAARSVAEHLDDPAAKAAMLRIGLAGGVSPGRQSDIGSDAPRPLEAGGVIDRRKEAKSRDCADARCCHEPSYLSIVARQPQHLAIEVGNLPLDSLARLQQRLDRAGEFWPILGQLRGTQGKLSRGCLLSLGLSSVSPQERCDGVLRRINDRAAPSCDWLAEQG